MVPTMRARDPNTSASCCRALRSYRPMRRRLFQLDSSGPWECHRHDAAAVAISAPRRRYRCRYLSSSRASLKSGAGLSPVRGSIGGRSRCAIRASCSALPIAVSACASTADSREVHAACDPARPPKINSRPTPWSSRPCSSTKGRSAAASASLGGRPSPLDRQTHCVRRSDLSVSFFVR